MKKSLYILSAVLCVAVSCAKEMSVSDFSRPNVEKVSLYASLVDSKTALQEDLSVFWNAGDRLVVFGDSLHYFTAAEGGAASVKFDGNFCYSDSVTVDAATSMYAIYPDIVFEGRDEVNGNVFDLFIQNVQQPLSAGFDNVAAIVVGKVVGNEIPMRQVSALAKFTISSSDITSVQVRSASGVNIAGTLPVTIADDGSVTTGEAQLPTILVIPSSGKTFAPGTYYFNVAPAALTGGLEMRLTRASDDKVATKVGTNPVTFKRAQVMNFGTIDEGLTWTGIATTKILMNFVEVDEDGNFTKTDGKTTYVHPFAIPSAFASSINNGTSKGVATTLVANAENGNLSYPAFSTAGFAKHAMGMRWGKGEGDYITIPKINGLTLQAVRVTYGGNADSYQPCGYLSITENGNPIAGGEMYKGFVGREDCAIWYIFSTDADKTYRMTCNQTAEVDFLRWEFLYSGTPEATVLGVLCSVEDAENSNATFKGSFSTYKDIEPDSYTCGFEYKTGAEDWTSIDADADFEFTYDVDFLTPGSEYTLRSWVDCGSGKYYSEPCVFTPTSIVKYAFDFVTSPTTDFTVYGIDVPTSSPSPRHTESYNTILIAKENNNILNLRFNPKTSDTPTGIYWASGMKFSYYGPNSYVSFPALNGLTLSRIDFAFGDVTGSSKHGIYTFVDGTFTCVSGDKKNADGYYTDGKSTLNIPKNSTSSFVLKNCVEGGQYYLGLASNKNLTIIQSITLTYTGVELPTLQLAKAPQYTSGSLSAEVYFNSVTKASDITAGFEKETATPGEFVAVSSGTVASLTGGKATITGSASLTLGDVVRVWVSFDGGTTKYVGETTTIM